MRVRQKTDSKISRLAVQLCQRDGLDLLGRLCSDDTLSYTFRLQVVDAALSVNLISRDELNQLAFMPIYQDVRANADVAESWWQFFSRTKGWLAHVRADKREAGLQRRRAALLSARQVEAQASDIRIYKQCSGPEFERMVARAFRKMGFSVEEMGGANDGGVDLHVRKSGRHAIVQCKAHARPIGPAVARELLGALRHQKTASIAYLVTTNGVTKSAREWCSDKPIELLLPEDLIRGV